MAWMACHSQRDRGNAVFWDVQSLAHEARGTVEVEWR